MVSKWFTRVNIAQVYFDNRRFHCCQRVTQRNRVVRERAGVDDDAIGFLGMLLEVVDDGSFVVRLEALYGRVQFGSTFL